jgi:hypothetical protein
LHRKRLASLLMPCVTRIFAPRRYCCRCRAKSFVTVGTCLSNRCLALDGSHTGKGWESFSLGHNDHFHPNPSQFIADLPFGAIYSGLWQYRKITNEKKWSYENCVPGAGISKSLYRRVTSWTAGVRLPQRLRPTQPSIQRVPGSLSQGVKRPGREADHSPPSITEVKKGGAITSTLPYVFMA